MHIFFDIIGVIGSVLMVLAFALVQLQKWAPTSLHYSLLNFCGAGLVLASLTVRFNLAAFILELFWMAMSLYGIAQYCRNKK